MRGSSLTNLSPPAQRKSVRARLRWAGELADDGAAAPILTKQGKIRQTVKILISEFSSRPHARAMATTAGRRRPTALDRPEHGGEPIALTRDQKQVLDEALRRGEDLREAVETQVTSYGRWILGEIFKGDTASALDEHSKNGARRARRRAIAPSVKPFASVGPQMCFPCPCHRFPTHGLGHERTANRGHLLLAA